MRVSSATILRLGLGITFAWIGVLIFKNPSGWANFLLDWFVKLLPLPPERFMFFISFLDMVIGVALIFNFFTKWVALIAAIHLVGILFSSGVTDVTVRDIGLLGACLSLFLVETEHIR